MRYGLKIWKSCFIFLQTTLLGTEKTGPFAKIVKFPFRLGAEAYISISLSTDSKDALGVEQSKSEQKNWKSLLRSNEIPRRQGAVLKVVWACCLVGQY